MVSYAGDVQGGLCSRRTFSEVDPTADTKTCTSCGKLLPSAEFFFPEPGIPSECKACAWDRMCRVPKDDLARITRVYRRYRGEDRDKIRERLHRRLAGEQWHRRLLAEAGYVVFASQRRRGSREHGTRDWFTIDDVQRLCDEQGNRCFYCGKELNERYQLDHKTPKSRGGNDSPENLCCACELCSRLKHHETAEEFMDYLRGLRERRPPPRE